jgi:hypothetical protein
MKFLAFDGKVFESVEECAAHEAARPEARVVGLTADQVAAALARTDADLAGAAEPEHEAAGVPLAPGAAS